MFDAAVIGGGLAGCHAAITLAQRGWRVLLLEAGEYPRAKVCGEFLSPEALALFEASGFLPRLHALKPESIRTVCITAPDGAAWRTTFPAAGVGVSRYALDAALADYAASLGVTVQTKTRVTGITGDLYGGFRVSVRGHAAQAYRAATVIAAHGRRSNLDRALNRAFLRHSQPYLGLKRHFVGKPLPNHLDLHVFPGGYCGMSHIEGGAMNVCLLTREDAFKHAGGTVESFVAWMSGANPALGAWLADAEPLYPDWLSIAQVPFMNKTTLEGDILLAGDAAGMIAPLAGDGMAMALHSGSMAAGAIDKLLTRQIDAQTMKRDYAEQWRKAFAARLRLGRTLQSIMLRPALLSPGLRILNVLPALGDVLVAQTRDLHLAQESRGRVTYGSS